MLVVFSGAEGKGKSRSPSGMTTRKASQGQKQIPFGDDNPKGKSRVKQTPSGMTTKKARQGQKQIPFGDDNQKGKARAKADPLRG